MICELDDSYKNKDEIILIVFVAFEVGFDYDHVL